MVGIMNNKFVKGLITGLGSSLLLVIIAMALYIRLDAKANDNDFSGSRSSSNGNNFIEGISEFLGINNEESEETFLKKKTYIKNLISKNYMGEVTEQDYRTAELKALLNALDDPYSCYYTKEEFAVLLESSNGVYSGIGAMVTQNTSTGVISIVKVFTGGPAHKAGILPGDLIYKIEDEEVTGLELAQVVSTMKGKTGTKVTIEVVREGVPEPIEYVITRGTVEVPTIEYEMLDNKIGYIYILEFDKVTEEQFRKAITDLEKQGMKGLVIDVRDNPGGLLNIVVGMLDRLLPEGMIVYTEDKNGKGDKHLSSNKEKIDIPLAVIINGNSASASEIFAGALQDYGLATIIGTKSFGKGVVQSLYTLSDGSAVKITVSRYFTPNGKCIHGEGIIPDIEVKLDEGLARMQKIPKEDDNQLQKAIEVIMEQIK